MKPSSTHAGLDSMVVEIELTLVSIIQGVALYFLIDNARGVISIQQAAAWPYVAAGLLAIFIFWSRSVLHIITLIRWPLEFGHNFLYVTCALSEALLFTRLANPRAWFAFGALVAIAAWLVFIYDLRLLRARERDSAGEASNRLYALVTRDQWLNIALLLPALILFNAVCAFSIHAWPEFFLARQQHVWLGGAQIVIFGGYLFYVLRFFKKLVPLISKSRQEWAYETTAS